MQDVAIDVDDAFDGCPANIPASRAPPPFVGGTMVAEPA